MGRTSVATTNLVTEPPAAHGDGQVGAGWRQGPGRPRGCGWWASAGTLAALPLRHRAFPYGSPGARGAPRPGGGCGADGGGPRGTDVAEGPL